MTKLTSMPCEYKDDTNQKNLENLWGDSWKKLTPKQRQLVGEILSNLNLTPVEAGFVRPTVLKMGSATTQADTLPNYPKVARGDSAQ